MEKEHKQRHRGTSVVYLEKPGCDLTQRGQGLGRNWAGEQGWGHTTKGESYRLYPVGSGKALAIINQEGKKVK